jgi:hypothetical protein
VGFISFHFVSRILVSLNDAAQLLSSRSRRKAYLHAKDDCWHENGMAVAAGNVRTPRDGFFDITLSVALNNVTRGACVTPPVLFLLYKQRGSARVLHLSHFHPPPFFSSFLSFRNAFVFLKSQFDACIIALAHSDSRSLRYGAALINAELYLLYYADELRRMAEHKQRTPEDPSMSPVPTKKVKAVLTDGHEYVVLSVHGKV